MKRHWRYRQLTKGLENLNRPGWFPGGRLTHGRYPGHKALTLIYGEWPMDPWAIIWRDGHKIRWEATGCHAFLPAEGVASTPKAAAVAAERALGVRR